MEGKMPRNKITPIRSKQHEINDIGTAVFHYAISKYMISRSIEKNDYGIDELIDVVDARDFSGETIKILPGQMFAVQLKSSTKRSNTHKLKNSTLNYLFYNNLPTFLVKVDVKSKKYSYANIRKQVRQNWTTFNRNEAFSLKLFSRLDDKQGHNVLKMLKERYLKQSKTTEADLELDYLLCNVSLLMEFSNELFRDEMETDILLFLATFDTHMAFLRESLINNNDLGITYEKINSGAELIMTYLRKNSGDFFRCQPKKDNSNLRSGLIYQELANMYSAVEALKNMFQTESKYWQFKYGYRMNNIWPDKLANKFTLSFGDIGSIVELGELKKISVILEENK